MKRPQARLLTLLGLGLVSLLPVGPSRAAPSEPEVHRWAFENEDGSEAESRVKLQLRSIVPGEGVRLVLLRDCTADGVPDPQGYGACRSPVDSWTTQPSDTEGNLEVHFDLAREEWKLPSNIVLWLQVRPTGAAAGDQNFPLVPIHLARDVCNAWESLRDTFLEGDCSSGLLHALRKHKGFDELAEVLFEVRHLRIGGDPGEATAIPQTLGATGVAWADAETLLVTRERVEGWSLSEQPEPPVVVPGLYRVDWKGGRAVTCDLIWESKDDLLPTAPYALPTGEIVFVRQPRVGDRQADEHAKAFLNLWRDGALVDTEIPLPLRIHQIVAASEFGDEILALSLGVRENDPAFLRVDLGSGEVTRVEYSHALYQTLLRSPRGEMSAVSFEDVSGRWGWELLLVDSSGRWIEILAHRKGLHDLMATWHPRGGELVYLAETSEGDAR